MGILAKQGIINSIIIYLGFGIGYLNVGILLPQYFTPSQIGVRETIVAYALVLATFGIWGNTSVLLKFFPKYSHLKKHGLLGMFLFNTIIAFLVTALLSYIFKNIIFKSLDNAPLFKSYFYYIYPIAFFFSINAILDSYFRSILLAHVSVFFREFLARILSSIVIIGYGLELYSFKGFMIGFTGIYAFNFLVSIIYIKTQTDHNILFPFKIFKLIDKKEFLEFAGYVFIASAAGVLVIQVDKMMITSIIDESQTAIYALAVYLATIIEAPRRALLQSAAPLISKSWQQQDFSSLKSIFTKSSINLQIVGSILFLLIWSSIDDIYLIIPKESIYAKGKLVVLYIGLTKLITMTFGLHNEIISYSPKYRYNLYLSIFLALLTISLNYLLVPKYGIKGAAIATLITFSTMNVIKQIIIWVEFRFNQFTSKNISLIGISLLIISITQCIPQCSNPFLNLIIKSSLISITFSAFTYYLKISEEVNGIIKKYILKKGSL